MNDEAPTKVAIACQGGGSHTAFTAGVLKGLLPELAPEYDLVGMSGTSGGAVSAVAAWQGLYVDGPGGVRERLDSLWSAIAASSPPERLLNE
ncbi:patatin-like phospholipase family protein [Saliphagus infecundisoli]|uniref:Patatin-like phospholipase family protein n=1 Tax=Saliphagus infecundisoli TaxID=1849069 RepID=A0ABD5QK29_9EURY|nr:patatin-like phospholipase family protein [Saliphagus infecundisoli]